MASAKLMAKLQASQNAVTQMAELHSKQAILSRKTNNNNSSSNNNNSNSNKERRLNWQRQQRQQQKEKEKETDQVFN